MALGAGRFRLVRQLLTESLALSTAGGLLGFALAAWGSRTLAMFITGQIFIVPVEMNLSLDWRILGFTIAAAVVTGSDWHLPGEQRAKIPMRQCSAGAAR